MLCTAITRHIKTFLPNTTTSHLNRCSSRPSSPNYNSNNHFLAQKFNRRHAVRANSSNYWNIGPWMPAQQTQRVQHRFPYLSIKLSTTESRACYSLPSNVVSSSCTKLIQCQSFPFPAVFPLLATWNTIQNRCQHIVYTASKINDYYSTKQLFNATRNQKN